MGRTSRPARRSARRPASCRARAFALGLLLTLGCDRAGDRAAIAPDGGRVGAGELPEGLTTAIEWSFTDEICSLDWYAQCEGTDTEAALARRPMSEADAARAAELARFLAEVGPSTPGHLEASLELGAIHLRQREGAAAVEVLEAVDLAEVDTAVAARARTLLLDALLLAVMQGGTDQVAEVVALASEVEGSAMWRDPTDAGGTLRARTPEVVLRARWLEVGPTYEHAAAGDQEAAERCVDDRVALYNDYGDLPEQVAARLLWNAHECAVWAGRAGTAVQLADAIVSSYPYSAEHREALYALGVVYERVLFFEEARKYYALFVASYADDDRVERARGRAVALSTMLPEADTDEALLDDVVDERLRKALDFRTSVASTKDLASLERLARGLEDDGERLRAFVLRARLADELFRQSCPLPGAIGLCMDRGAAAGVGSLAARNRTLEARAQTNLERARAAQAADDWDQDPYLAYGAPVALSRAEVEGADVRLALLEGDLGAEDALSHLPPLSYAPDLVEVWRERRESEVDAMARAYARIGESYPGSAGVAAARAGLVYESDADLLDDVARQMADRDTALASSLRKLASTRRIQALEAYASGLELIAAWGQDIDGAREFCAAGIGRLLGQDEDALQYAPSRESMRIYGSPG